MTITDSNFQSDKLTIFSFPPFAGGKCIMNCLSLSRYTVPLIRSCVSHLLDYPDDYQYRLDAVLSTLPPVDELLNWKQHEVSDCEFYGGPSVENLNQLKQGTLADAQTAQFLTSVLMSNKRFFMTTHGSAPIRATDVFPNARIVVLINYLKFWHIAANLKHTNANTLSLSDIAGNGCNEKYQLLKGEDWPDWEIFERNYYNIKKVAEIVDICPAIQQEISSFYQWDQITNPVFCLDVDNSYFNRTKFLATMKQLYNWFGFDDFNPDLVGHFWQSYMALHVANNIDLT